MTWMLTGMVRIDGNEFVPAELPDGAPAYPRARAGGAAASACGGGAEGAPACALCSTTRTTHALLFEDVTALRYMASWVVNNPLSWKG